MKLLVPSMVVALAAVVTVAIQLEDSVLFEDANLFEDATLFEDRGSLFKKKYIKWNDSKIHNKT